MNKNIVILISFFSLFLLGGGTVKESFLQEEGMKYVLPCLAEKDVFGESELSNKTGRFNGDMLFSDVQSMARQLNVRAERMIRFSVAQSKWYSKALMRKISLCKDGLTHQIFHWFTSIRRLSWDMAVDYYVFELRHILI